MRTFSAVMLVPALLSVLSSPVYAGTTETDTSIADLTFSGYRFGQEPSANMVCLSGYCKSQAPGGDGVVTFPYSTYGTPGAVSTLSSLSIVDPRYTFWNDQLYRVSFKVDCAPLEMEECVGDIVTALDHEYILTPLSSNESRQFVLERQASTWEFLTESGAIVKIRATTLADGPMMPLIDISDKEMTNQVGSSLNPNFKPKKYILPKGPSSEH